jgi:hypothetical protein
MRPDSNKISHACLTHLAREEAQLRVTLTLLERIHSALLRSDVKELTVALEDSARTEAGSAELSGERQHLLEDLATDLAIAVESLTLRRLVEALPPGDRSELTQASERLRTLYSRVDDLVRSNTSLAAYGLGFIRRCLSTLTGTGLPAGRYGANGTHLEVSFRSLISRRG